MRKMNDDELKQAIKKYANQNSRCMKPLNANNHNLLEEIDAQQLGLDIIEELLERNALLCQELLYMEQHASHLSKMLRLAPSYESSLALPASNRKLN